ncbi:hypothetical protein BRADI_2g23255v3 [Brachypodium distachyon]|uniref:Uncharacterized protein n=1 Tax=Brachypodium distachyon TaxID=15368 RepID=A0A0Q3G682_BRADI|nr:hypothetical protein BRADI_2g23255v3 [Brachypodium distachyon]
MPLGGNPEPRASSSRRRLVPDVPVVAGGRLLWRWTTSTSQINSLTFLCKDSSVPPLEVRVIVVVALRREDGSGLKIFSCGRAHQQGIPWRSVGACNRSPAPAVPLHLLVEGRPNLFLLTRVPIWRQFFPWLVVAATNCDSSSSPTTPSSSNSFHSTNEFSIIICKSKSANCSLIAPALVAISRFQNVVKLGVEKKGEMLWLQDAISSSNKPRNRKKVDFLVLSLAKEKSPYTRPSNFFRGLSKRFAI